jgi:hypothetical protein
VRDLLEVREPEPADVDEVDQVAVGAWLLPEMVWLGLSWKVLTIGERRGWKAAADQVSRDTAGPDQTDRDQKDDPARGSGPVGEQFEGPGTVYQGADGHVVVLAGQ